MRKVLSRFGFIATLALLFLAGKSLSQNVTVVITIYGGSSNGSTCSGNNSISATLKNSGGTVVGTYSKSTPISYGGQWNGDASYIIYQANLSNGWTGKISASGSSCLGSTSIAEQNITFSTSDTQCNYYYFQNGNASVYQLQLTVEIYAPIGNALINNSAPGCGVSSVNLSLESAQHSGSTFNWQVSQDNANWVTFRPNAASSITATIAELHQGTFTISAYQTHYIRAVGTNCPNHRITPKVEVAFKPGYTTVTPTWTKPNCNGEANGSVKVDFTTGGIGTAYNSFQVDLYDVTNSKDVAQLFSSAGVAVSFTGLKAGTYNIHVEYENDPGCPTDKNGQVLGEPAALSADLRASVKNNFNISCLNSTDGTLQLYQSTGSSTKGAIGGTGTLTYSWSPGGSTANGISSLGAGTYTVTIKDRNGASNACVLTKSFELKSPSKNPTVALTSIGGVTDNSVKYDVSCDAVKDGSIQATITTEVTGGTPTYTWTGTDASTQTTATITGLGDGDYGITAKDGNGCAATNTKKLTNRPNPDFTIETISPLCPGASNGILEVKSLKYAGTSPTYKWAVTNETTAKITGKAAGSYSVTVTDGITTACKTAKTQPLADPVSYTVDVTRLNRITCFGGSDGSVRATVLNGVGATPDDVTKYTWTKDAVAYPAGTGLTTLSGLADARYECTATYGANNCTAKGSFNLIQPTRVVASIAVTSNYNGSEISCPGLSDGSLYASSTGGRGTHTYKWGSGDTTRILSGKPKGTYKVIATDGNGCVSAEVSETLDDPTSITAGISVKSDFKGVPISCNGSLDGKLQASASGGSGTITYKWNTGASGPDLIGLGEGTYTVTVKDANGCTIPASRTILDPDPVTASISLLSNYNGLPIKCNGSSDGKLQVIPAGGTSPYSYQWNAGPTPTSNILNGIPAGTYSVIVKDDNNCPAILNPSHTILPPDKVEASITPKFYNGKNLSCNNSSDGELKVSATGGTGAGTYTYSWSTGSASDKITSIPAGTYSVIARDKNDCPSSSVAHTMLVPTAVQASITALSDYNGTAIRCYNSVDGTLKASARGGVGRYVYTWNNGVIDSLRVNIGAGSYTVVAKDANNCSANTTYTVLNPQQVVANVTAFSNYNGSTIKCNGSSDGELEVNTTGGKAPYTYVWNTGSTGKYATGLPSGDYNVVATDLNNCPSQTANFTIVDPALVQASIVAVSDYNGSTIRCNGSSDGILDASVTGGTGGIYTYTWSNGFTGSRLSGIPAGSYTLIASDLNNCPSTLASFSISDPQPVQAAIEITSSYNGKAVRCYNTSDGAVEVVATGGTESFSYLWTTGDSGNELGGLAAGSYNVVALDENNCSDTAMVYLDAPEPLVSFISSISDYHGYGVSCFGLTDGFAEVTASGGMEGYSYSWLQTTELSSRLEQIGEGDYTVEVTDINGCTDTATASITSPQALSLDVVEKNHVSCYAGTDGSITVLAIGGAGSFLYSIDSEDWISSPSFNLIKAGLHTFEVKDSNGCLKALTDSLSQPDPIVIAFSDVTRSYCSQPHGSARALVTGGSPGYLLEWRNSQNILIDTAVVVDSLAADVYTLNVNDAKGCSTLNSLVITNTDGPSVSVAELVEPKCSTSSDGSVSIAVSGNSPFEYLWSDGQTTVNAMNLAKGLYNVVVTDTFGCQSVESITVSSPDPITINSFEKTQPSCYGNSDGKIKAIAIGGVGSYQYTWNGGLTTQEIISLVAGDYSVIVRDNNGCESGSISTHLSQPELLSISLVSRTLPTCFGFCDGSIEVNASGGNGGYAFTWGNSATGPKAKDLCAGQHIVSVMDSKGCTLQNTLPLGQPEAIRTYLVKSTRSSCYGVCDGGVEVGASGGNGGYNFLWDDGTASKALVNACPGTRKVSISDKKGCTLNDQPYQILQPEILKLKSISRISPSCNGQCDGQTEVSASGGNGEYKFVWDDGTTANKLINLCAGIRKVTVTDKKNCVLRDQLVEITQPLPLEVKVLSNQSPTCFGSCNGSLEVTGVGGNGKYKYTWTSGSVSNKLANICAGTYTVNVLDEKGCAFSGHKFEVVQPEVISLEVINIQSPACYGQCDGSIEIAATGGNGTFQYAWDNGSASNVLENACTGSNKVTVTDKKGCTLISEPYELSEPDQLVVSLASSQSPSCNGECDGKIEVNASGGNGEYQYLWDDGSALNLLDAACAGARQVTVTDMNGCVVDQSYFITQPEEISAHVVTTQFPTCNGDCDGSLKIEASGGAGTYSYNWSNGTTGPLINAVCAGNYTVTIVDGNDCKLQNQNYELTEPDLLTVELNRMALPKCSDDCDGMLVVDAVGGNGNYKFAWSSGATAGMAANLCPGDYNITISDEKSCEATSTFTVENVPPLTIDLGGSSLVCVGQTHVLQPEGTWTKFNWSSNTGFTSNQPKIAINQAGLYWVEVEDAEGCTAQDTFLLETSSDLLEASLAMASEAQVADTVVIVDLSWPLPDHITWHYPPQLSVLADYGDIVYGQFYEPGTFEVTLNAELGGCKDTMTKRITILENSTDPIGGRLGFEDFVKLFELFPNPNDGSFDVGIELAEESDITLSVWSTITSLNVGIVKDRGNSKYLTHVDLRPLSSGTYVLRLDHAKGHESIRFIVH
jgi:hypothetical protein